MTPYIVNISSIQDYMQCPYRWLCRWVLNRLPKGNEKALEFGKLLHCIYEDFFLGKSMEESIAHNEQIWLQRTADTSDMYEKKSALDALEELDNVREVLLQWRDKYEFDVPVLEVEEPFTITSPLDDSVCLRGRPDRVGVLYGRLVHVQNRGLAATVNFELYVRLAKRHLHELVYGYALARKYEGQYSYGGTVFNLLRKLKHRRKPSKKDPEGAILHTVDEMLGQAIVNYSDQECLAGVDRATRWAQKMRTTEEWYKLSGEMPLPNEKLNGGFNGNIIDPFFRVLEGEISLDDDEFFKNREDQYAGLEERGADLGGHPEGLL